jgi:hypothetical protein
MKILFKLFAAGTFFATTASALADVHYVDVNGTDATPPYSSWATAATNIQDAVDAAVAGDEIVVTNGIYATGGRSEDGYTTNRVAIDKSVTVQSVNGPQLTTIDGGGSVRCVYFVNGSASLSGFTLTNGYADKGGGVYCEYPQFSHVVVSNCVITGNRVYISSSEISPSGGGAYGGSLIKCTLTGNSAILFLRHTPSYPLLNRYAYGGGAAFCTLNNCILSDNLVSADNADNDPPYNYKPSYIYAYGGGAYRCTLDNCVFSANSSSSTATGLPGLYAYSYGGGASECNLNNCTLLGNSALCFFNLDNLSGASGGGASEGTLNNCIAWDNFTDPFNEDSLQNYDGLSDLNYCCTTPLPSYGVGNITNEPLFDYASAVRLQPNSPCINAGDNSYVTSATDLDGNPRVSGGTVDIGAYEYQWPITPSGIPPNGIVLTWPTNNLGYDYTGFTVQSTTNLIPPLLWDTNSPAPVVINGQNVVTNPITGDQKFFRLSQ